MLRYVLPICLLLTGCLHYKIRVDTTVMPDGRIERGFYIQEKSDEHKTWEHFARPGFKLDGTPSDGFRGVQRLRFGTHKNGIRRLKGKPKGDAGQDLAYLEGRYTVEALDLMVGKLYRYYETIDIGVDPVRFRDELPRWLDMGLRLVVETLKIKLPDIDFAPVEKHARETLLPKVERTLIGMHQALGGLLVDERTIRHLKRTDELRSNPNMKVLLAELARYGFVRKKDAPGAEDLDEFFDEDHWVIEGKIVDELLAPLKVPDAKRKEIRGLLLNLFGEEMEEAAEAAAEKIFPKEQKEKLERELEAFGYAALGYYFTIFDKYEFRFTLRMPGRVLQTNAELGGLPVLQWNLTDKDVNLVPPHLVAFSFVPEPGLPEAGWSLTELLEVRDALQGLEPDDRDAVVRTARQALRGGRWTRPDDTKLSDEARQAIQQIDATVPR